MLRTKDSGLDLLTKNSAISLDTKEIGADGTFEGYGSIFGNIDSYGEIVEPGAFAASLASTAKQKRSIKMLWQHDSYQPIGIWEELTEDNKGLRARGRLLIDVSPKAAEAYGLLKEGALDGLSIGYRVLQAKPHADKPNVISLTKLDLREISVVTFAANDRARVDSVKHQIAAGVLPTVRQLEEILRDAGLSKAKSAAIAGSAAPHLRGDPESHASDLDRFFRALDEA